MAPPYWQNPIWLPTTTNNNRRISNNVVNQYVIGPNIPICDTFKLGTYFKFKMAAKTDNFRISPISANIWIENLSEIPRYMLLDTINTFLILLNWSHDVSQYGGQKPENFQKIPDIYFTISATNQN